jgi:hypothetical protein
MSISPRIDLYLVLFADRHDRHRRGRGMNAAGLLGCGDALDTMYACLKAQLAIDIFAADLKHCFFVSAQIGFRFGEVRELQPCTSA